MTESDRLKQAIGLLIIANCPQCDGSGSFHGPNGEQCQCQWCHERAELIEEEFTCRHHVPLNHCCNACSDSGKDPRKGYEEEKI